MFNISLSDLPPFGKLFVALFTTLSVLACFWAMTVFYLDKGLIMHEEPVEYNEDYQQTDQEELQQDVEEILADSEAVLAPDWDSSFNDEGVALDSEELVEGFEKYESEKAGTKGWYEEDSEGHLADNVATAHTHINGQTLLFFAMGLVFLFTSVRPKVKKITLSVLAVSILAYAIGLSGESFHWFYGDIFTISGLVMILTLLYMAVVVYIDLLRKQTGAQDVG